MGLPLRSRLAPTPSGYLHLGNLANFLLTEKLVRKEGGTLLLRIDDCDATRARPEFIEHIFETLQWLGIRWEEGPQDASDFARSFSQSARKEFYFQKLDALRERLYACACSRKEGGGQCSGACRDQGLAFIPGEHALRLRLGDPTLAARFGDVVVWRKDNGPAYQWVSVVDDLDARINLIVRGEDLRESSDLQRHIASLLVPGGFEGVRFVHHPLLTDEQGRKLAKSQSAPSVQELRKEGVTAQVLRVRLAQVIEGWGF